MKIKNKRMKAYSFVILAGGLARRMGQPKHSLKTGGKTFLELLVTLAENYSNDIIISGNPEKITCTKYKVIPDEIKNCGPIGGLYTCIKQAKNQNIIVLPIDMPLISNEILDLLINSHNENSFATIISHRDKPFPVLGIYSKKILPEIESKIKSGDYKILNLLRSVPHQTIDASGLENADKQLQNINTPEDYKAVE